MLHSTHVILFGANSVFLGYQLKSMLMSHYRLTVLKISLKFTKLVTKDSVKRNNFLVANRIAKAFNVSQKL